MRYLIALLLMVVCAPSARSQMPATPFSFGTLHDPYPTWTVELMYAKGFNSASNLDAVSGWASLEGERIRGTLGVGVVTPDGFDAEPAIAGKIDVKLTGLTLIPVVAQLGAGYVRIESGSTTDQRLDVPIGIAIGFDGRSPLSWVSNGIPWLGIVSGFRRTQRNSVTGDATAVRGMVGLSAGLNVGFPLGLGVLVQTQWLRVRQPFVSDWATEWTLSMGAFFRR